MPSSATEEPSPSPARRPAAKKRQAPPLPGLPPHAAAPASPPPPSGAPRPAAAAPGRFAPLCQTAGDPFGLLSAASAAGCSLAEPPPSLAELAAFAAQLPAFAAQQRRFPPPPPAPTGLAAASAACEACGGAMLAGSEGGGEGGGRLCEDCGRVEAADDDGGRPAGACPQIRAVGPGCAAFQGDLYRCSPDESPEVQTANMLEEFLAHRARHAELTGRPPVVGVDACRAAAALYNKVQRVFVKRNLAKLHLMAAALSFAALTLGTAVRDSDIAAMLALPQSGIARGVNAFRALVAAGDVEGVELPSDSCRPEVNAIFASLGVPPGERDDLRALVFELVQTAIRHHVGVHSVMRSKVAGAAFAVLSRAPLAPGGKGLSYADFTRAGVRRNTIDNFARDLEAHRSIFAPVYARAGFAGLCRKGAAAAPAAPPPAPAGGL